MEMRNLGSYGPAVAALALGCMGMSGMYGASDEAESVRTVHAAIDAGINLLDTGDFYGMGHNELLVRKAIEGRRDQVLLSVKFGALRDPRGGWLGFDARPAAVKNFLAYSLQRLGVDHIDIYRPARLDPGVPIEETVGAIAELIQAGYVRYIGLSEVGADTLRRAQRVHPISDLQIEYSLITRGVEAEILPAIRELGLGVTAYGVLSRGLLSGSAATGKGDFRAFLPRFRGPNLTQNKRFVDALATFAGDHGATPAQVAVAWVLARGETIVPVVGARKVQQIEDAIRALDLHLSPGAMAELDALATSFPVAGTRYDERQMQALDSERSSA